jgi:hypothetical protein
VKGYGRLLKYLRAQTARIVFGLVMMGIFALFSGFSIAMLYPIFDIVLVPRTAEDISRSQIRADIPFSQQFHELTGELSSEYGKAIRGEETWGDAGRYAKDRMFSLLRENPPDLFENTERLSSEGHFRSRRREDRHAVAQ